MIKTKIKERYQEGFIGFWLNKGEEDKEFSIVKNIGNMTLLYNEESGLLLDIFNNKIERFAKVDNIRVFVEAKNVEYADRFNLYGVYEIVDFEVGSPVLLKLVHTETNEIAYMMPSRLRVVQVREEV